MLLSRRAIAVALAPLMSVPFAPVRAFDNALPEVKDEIATKPAYIRDSKPGDIGLKPGGSLRPCLDGKPHCFSSSTTVGDYQADTSKIGTDWVVRPWTYDGMSVAGAMGDIKAIIDAYPPGQAGIDAGGFRIASIRLPETVDDVGYIYIQFESGGRGYIDDMEFAVRGGVVNVRTSSRLGYLDFGVNAKRYNYFATALGKKKGWHTPPVRKGSHLEYFAQNGLDTDADAGLL
mmetsp:Transcript_43803/g.115106  ORF Transcript_43803/g.115106 Transcript_43803/m.115106 type:complete len:232 (+) Transcript_43803:77-772(+)